MNTDVISLQNATGMSVDPKAAPSKDLGKNEFLRLLMTQLSQQDPLNPTDSTEFVSQLSQFTQVEGIFNLSSKLDELVKLTGANNSAIAVSLLGKEVRVSGNAIKGNADVYFDLPRAADKAVLTVRDKSGDIVKVMDTIPRSPGLHRVTLEGLQDGEYSFVVEAQDVQGEEIQASLSHAEKVNGVSYAGSVPVLLMESGKQMNATDVIEIREPKSMTSGENHG